MITRLSKRPCTIANVSCLERETAESSKYAPDRLLRFLGSFRLKAETASPEARLQELWTLTRVLILSLASFCDSEHLFLGQLSSAAYSSARIRLSNARIISASVARRRRSICMLSV